MRPVAPADDVMHLLRQLRPLQTNVPLVRIGGDGDGGYLVPDDLDGVVACFSPGVADSSRFELELAQRGIRSHLADYSVDGPAESHPSFDFEKKFLGSVDNDVFTRLDSWVARHTPDVEGDLLLQMDIESGEYAVISETSSDVLRRFRILVIEFHDLYGLLDPLALPHLRVCFEKLLHDFDVVHIHPNNCVPALRHGEIEVHPIMEFTFVRKDRGLCSGDVRTDFPHPLDRANVTGRPHDVLPRCWYASGSAPA